MEFIPFPSIARLSRETIVSEKIDGTNAQIYICDDGTVLAGSRNKWITPQDDNFGFARWVKEHENELRAELGFGQHFGEWWGAGIGRRYNLKEKRFSLFNVSRWNSENTKLCHVVPTLYRGVFDTARIDEQLELLRVNGSVAAPGFMNPEGVVVFHVPSGNLYKKTLDKNDAHKGA
jgi:hypothetical protein